MGEGSFFSDDKITFAGLSNESIQARADIEGEKIWEFIHRRDPSFGGCLMGIFGMMGSGKSSMLHHVCRRVLKENPREKIFWREPLNNPLQVRNNGCAYQLLCEKRHPVTVKLLTDDGLVPSDDIPVRLFSGFKDLLAKSEPGVISVVYLNELSRWISLIDRLKITAGWKSIFIDEAEDLFPLRVSGSAWAMNERFSNSIKEIRKSFISIYYNSQQQMDLDYRVSSKTMVHAYLYGSRRDEHSPLFKGVIQSLEQGACWLDLARARFGLIRFGPVEPVFPLYYVVPARRKNNED